LIPNLLRRIAFDPPDGVEHGLSRMLVAIQPADDHEAELHRGGIERRRVLDCEQRRLVARDSGSADDSWLARERSQRLELGIDRGGTGRRRVE
jgi:hypothetical protein